MAEAAAPAAPANAPAADAKSAGSKKKLFIIIGIVVFVLAAGGGGAAFFLKSHNAEPAKAGAKGAKAAKEKEPAKPKGPALYAKLDPPFVVNFEAKGVMRFLQVTVEVMTRDSNTAELIKANDPMIRNDLLLLFGNQTIENIDTREGKEKLRADALQVVSKIVNAEGGDGKKVEQLFFTSFVMQ